MNILDIVMWVFFWPYFVYEKRDVVSAKVLQLIWLFVLVFIMVMIGVTLK